MLQRKFLGLLIVLCSFLSTLAHAASGNWWEKIFKEYQDSVVQVEPIMYIGLNVDASDEMAPSNGGAGTGFVVDADKGIIVTNYHLLTASPNVQTKIRFKNGEEVDAKVLYVDPWVDFAFAKYDPKTLSFKPKSVQLGSHSDVHENDEVLLIGNSSSMGISYKLGYINYLFKPNVIGEGQRISHYIHATLGRAGGASGSPVWNKSGKVIGLHSKGKDFEAFFVRVDYIKTALEQLQRAEQPKRGDLYFKLTSMPESEAKKFFALPTDLIKQGIHENNGPHYVLRIGMVVPGTKAAEVIKPGDIVLSIQGKNESKPVNIGNSVYTFEKITNENVDKNVKLSVYRPTDRKIVNVELPVFDANKIIPKEYSQIGSAIFQNVTAPVALVFGIPMKGVFTPFVGDPDSSGWNYGLRCKFTDDSDQRSRCFLIRAINGVEINNLQDFNREIEKHIKDPSVLISIYDFAMYNHASDTKYVDLKLEQDMSLKKKTLDPVTLDWKTEEIKK